MTKYDFGKFAADAGGKFAVGDKVRIKSGGKMGVIAEIPPPNRYYVKVEGTPNLGLYAQGELEKA